MSECKKTCGNCAGRIKSILSKDRCDITEEVIEDMSSTCNDWEPNNEVLREMKDDELKSLRQERDELQAQVAVLRGALEEVRKGHIESRFDHEDGASIEVFVRDVHIVIDQALDSTPSDASERVQKLVAALEEICKEFSDTETDVCTTIQTMHDKAQKSISEWKKP